MVAQKSTVTKNEMRRVWRKKRDSLDVSLRRAADEAIFSCLHASELWRSATQVLSYLSVGAEVDTRMLIEAALLEGKTVALPRCVGPRRMRWHTIQSLDGLEQSKWGIEEPPDREETLFDLNQVDQALIVVPGLVFDKHGMRLGYGGGYYDTFLTQVTGSPTVGLARSCQLVEDLSVFHCVEEHDFPVEYVVCEHEILHSECA